MMEEKREKSIDVHAADSNFLFPGRATAKRQRAKACAHKKQPLPLGTPYDPRHSPTVGS